MAKCEHDRVRSTCSICKPEQVFRQYDRKAVERNLSFSVTLEEFERLTQAPCFYCGENDEPRGLDRRDNRIGYNLRNCVSACSECNFMKRAMLEYRFLNRVMMIAKHQESQKKKAA
jgi:hypothetical protein